MSSTNVDFGILMHTEGAQQASAGVAQVDNSVTSLERSTVRVQKAQADLAAATARTAAEQAKHAKLVADASTSQEKLAQSSARVVQAQAAQAAATVATKDAQAALTRQTQGLGAAHALTAQQTQQLGFQLNDFFVQVASGGNPMMALIQQGSQLSGTFGGLRGRVAALGTVFTPLRLAIGGAAAAAGVLAFGFLQGNNESKELARNLAITGNAAGLTEQRFNSLAQTIATETKTSIGGAREALLQLAASGRLSSASLESTFRAVQQVSKATGESASDVARRFLALTDGVAKGAVELNKQFNFLSIEQYRVIKSLEDQGNVQAALAVTMQALSARVGDQTQNLGYAERAWGALTRTVSGFWDSIKALGRDSTLEEQITKLGKAAEVAANSRGRSTRSEDQRSELVTGLRQEQALLQENLRLRNRQATVQGEQADLQKRAIAFEKEIEGSLSSQAKLAKELADYRARAEPLRAAGKLSDADFKRGERDIVQTSAADAQRIAAGLARIDAQAGVAVERIKGRIGELQHQVAIGHLTQIDGIERITAAEVEQLEGERELLRQQITFARQRKENDAEVIRLQGEVARKEEEIANKRAEGQQKVAKAINDAKRAEQRALAEADTANTTEIEAALTRQAQERLKITEAIAAGTLALNENAELLRLEESLTGSTNEQRRIANEQLRIRQKLQRDLNELEGKGFSPGEIEQRRQRLEEDAARAAGQVAARVALEFRTRAADQIERDLLNAAVEGGHSLVRYLTDLFKRQTFEVILRPFLQPFSAAIAAGASSAAFGGQAGTAGGSTLGMFQAGKTLYDGFASGFAGAGGAAANLYSYGATYAGSTYGTGFATQQSAMLAAQESGMGAAAGSNAGLFGSVATVAAGVAAGIYGGRAISGGYSAIGSGSGNTAVNVGTAAGGVIGGIVGLGNPITIAIGSAIGGAIGGLVNRAFGRKAPEVEGRFIEGSFTGGDFSGSTGANIVEKGGWFRSDKRYTELTAITGDLDKALDEGGKKIADLAKLYGAALGLPVESLSNVTEQIKVTITDDAEENSKAIAEALGKYSQSLLAEFAPALESLRLSGESTAQVIERVGTNLIQVNDALKLLGLQALETSVAGGKAATELADLFGGLGNLGQAVGSYYAQYTSEADQLANVSKAAAVALGAVNLTLPDTREGFVALVKAQNASTESGRNALAALLGVAGGLDAVYDASERAALDKAEKDRQKAEDTARERYDLETRKLRALGDTTALRDREVEALDESNRGLLRMIFDLEDAAAAAEALGKASGTIVGPKGQKADSVDFAKAVAGVTQKELSEAAARMGSVWQMYLENNVAPSIGALTNSIALGKLADNTQPNPGPERITVEDGSNRAREEEARAMGQLTDSINRLREGLGEYLGSLLQSDISTLSPERKYLEAQSAFDSVSKKAMMGDQTAAGQLRDVSQTFLQASRAYLGPSAGFGMNFDLVVQVLRDSQKVLETIASTGQADLFTNQQGLAELADQLAAGNDATRRMVDRTELDRQERVA